ncbi:MAG TPA: glycerol-3-phosphate 1-O-acyltransferase PlsY [Steroidobacteraceae bacterium]|nr:glycerol-3-phosphate 1-O-acyltransferase PlsY [Steroidobacteraceae bacterium]
MTELIVKGALAYLLGSVVGSLLIGKFRGIDIRTMGSGNAGATNMLRTQGKAVALAVLVIDFLKGWLATAVLAAWRPPGAAADPALHAWCISVCGLAVMIGHVYPLWYGFRGGKGVATFLGAVLGVSPMLALVAVAVWVVVVIVFGFVSLGSMLAAAAVAVVIATGSTERQPLLLFGVLAALLIIYTHRANIARLRAGSESRARRLWLFGTRQGKD